MGIIRNRNAHGNSAARKTLHPRNRTMSPASSRMNEETGKEELSPHLADDQEKHSQDSSESPDHEGRMGSRARRSRSCQSTNAEKRVQRSRGKNWGRATIGRRGATGSTNRARGKGQPARQSARRGRVGERVGETAGARLKARIAPTGSRKLGVSQSGEA